MMNTDLIIQYVNEIVPVIIAVLSATGSIVTCIKTCKNLAAKHDESLKREVQSLREENRQLRETNKIQLAHMNEVSDRLVKIEEKYSKIKVK